MIGIIQETGSAFHLKQSKHNVKFRFVDRRRRCARKAIEPSAFGSRMPFFRYGIRWFFGKIKEVKTSIKIIRKALLGDSDTGLESGIVNEITKIKASLKVNNSWINLGRPIIIAVVSAALTFLITTKII